MNDYITIFFITLLIILTYRVADHISENKNKDKKETKSDIDLSQYVFDKDEPQLYTNVLRLVDSFIDEALETYLKIQAYPPDHYITSEEAKTISSYVLASVAKNMTPSVVNIISSVYVINSDQDLTDFLKLRIKLRIVDVMVNVNIPTD